MELDEALRTIEHLERALASRTTTAMALGILMERYGISQPAAWAALVRTSQQKNEKIVSLAERILDGERPLLPAADLLSA